MTRRFNVFVDDMTADGLPHSEHVYQIALAPSAQQCCSMATKQYFSDAQLVTDLLARLNYTPAAVNRFFASERQDVLVNVPLSEDDAAYLGWHPDFDKR